MACAGADGEDFAAQAIGELVGWEMSVVALMRLVRGKFTADSGRVAEVDAVALPVVFIGNVDAGLIILRLPACIWVFGRSRDRSAFGS